MNVRVHSTTLRGLKTGWMEAGEKGRPILMFLHGYPDSPETWQAQMDHFSSRFHVLAPFSRGAALSEKGPLHRYRKDATSLDLLQLLHEVDPTGELPVFLAGHDLGAVHAWNLAPLLGRRLKALVVVNGLSLAAMMGRLRSLAQHRRSWYIYAMQLPWLPEALVRTFPDGLLDFAHRLGRLPRAQRLLPEQVEGCLENPLNQYRAFLRDLPRQRRTRLPRLEAPVMVLWGKEDPFLLVPAMREWERVAVDVTTRLLPAGHWVHRERPAEVNRLLEKFFDAKFPQGGTA